MWNYTEKVEDHFRNPRNVGAIDNPDGVGQVGSMACGDALRLTFKLDKDDRIAEARFKTFGCASAIASSSALTEIIKGMTLEEAAAVTNQQVADYLGGLPEQKMHCSVMAREALEAAIENYRTGTTEKRTLEGDVVCTCFGVTRAEIERAIVENGLTSVEEVTNYTKAGGGCGGCTGQIEEIITELGAAPPAEEPPPKRRMTNIERIRLVEETLEREVRPGLRNDGGDIELVDVEGPRVVISFRGSCAKCRVSEFTMRDVVQAKLREFVDEAIVVEEESS